MWARKIAELGNHTMAPNHGLDGVSDYPTPSAHVVLSDVMSARRDEHSLPSARMTIPAHHGARSLPHR